MSRSQQVLSGHEEFPDGLHDGFRTVMVTGKILKMIM